MARLGRSMVARSARVVLALVWLAAPATAWAGGGGQGGEPAVGGSGGLGGSGGSGAFGGGGQGGSSADADADGYSVLQGDCDDGDPYVHPGAGEICNGIDDDCNGAIDDGLGGPGAYGYRDDDGDGWGTGVEEWLCLGLGVGAVVQQGGDCDDTRAATHPYASETCNGRDDDCDGYVDNGSCDNGHYAGPTPSADLVSGLLLAGWLGLGAYRNRRRLGK